MSNKISTLKKSELDVGLGSTGLIPSLPENQTWMAASESISDAAIQSKLSFGPTEAIPHLI
jgi:hypothetical protein